MDLTKNNHKPVMIWTRNGAWLQTFTQFGELRLSFVGEQPLNSLRDFCRQHDIDFLVCDRQDRVRLALTIAEKRQVAQTCSV